VRISAFNNTHTRSAGEISRVLRVHERIAARADCGSISTYVDSVSYMYRSMGRDAREGLEM
jgi:tetrahydromethanopterin S-methyltransferase subunit F